MTKVNTSGIEDVPGLQNASIAGDNATGRTQQIVVFRLGQEEYGLHIGQIKEVVITPAITRMPQAPSYMKGVANIRGNVIAMIDLEDKFGLSAAGSDHRNFTLVIASDEYKMGILVKEVPNTLTISADAISETVFAADGSSDHSYMKGIVKVEKRLIIMIDIFKVINDRDEQQLLKGKQSTAA